MITVHKADQLKRFAPFLYLSHSFILSVNVKVCITFIVLLQISLCFFLCQESYWMRGVCIRLGGGGGGGGGGGRLGGYFCWGCQYPITCHVISLKVT